jgi:hypothetical protein
LWFHRMHDAYLLLRYFQIEVCMPVHSLPNMTNKGMMWWYLMQENLQEKVQKWKKTMERTL